MSPKIPKRSLAGTRSQADQDSEAQDQLKRLQEFRSSLSHWAQNCQWPDSDLHQWPGNGSRSMPHFGDIRHVMWWYRMAPGLWSKTWSIGTHTHTHILNVRTTTVLSQKIPHFFLHHTVIPPWHDMTQRYIQIIEESVGMNIHCFVGTMFTMARNPDRETLRPFGHQSQYCPRKLLPIHTLQGLKSLSVLCYILFTWIIGNRQVTCSTSSMTMRNLAMATDHNPRTGTDTCEDPPMRLKNHDLCRFVLQRFDCLFTVLSYALSYENRFHIEVCLRKGSAKSIQLIQSSMMSLLRSAVPVMSG